MDHGLQEGMNMDHAFNETLVSEHTMMPHTSKIGSMSFIYRLVSTRRRGIIPDADT